MKVACIQYKSYKDERKTLKKLIPLIQIAAKKKVDLITLHECATNDEMIDRRLAQE